MDMYADTRAVDELESIIADSSDDLHLAVSRIPALFSQNGKATFLGYRSLGLSGEQAMMVMGLPKDTLNEWRIDDPEFFKFELRALPLLQKNISVELLRMSFLRNMALFMFKDGLILQKSFSDDELTGPEERYLLKVRSHYTPSDLLSLEKAVNPDAHREKTVINLSWGEGVDSLEVVEQEMAQLEAGETVDAEFYTIPAGEEGQ